MCSLLIDSNLLLCLTFPLPFCPFEASLDDLFTKNLDQVLLPLVLFQRFNFSSLSLSFSLPEFRFFFFSVVYFIVEKLYFILKVNDNLVSCLNGTCLHGTLLFLFFFSLTVFSRCLYAIQSGQFLIFFICEFFAILLFIGQLCYFGCESDLV